MEGVAADNDTVGLSSDFDENGSGLNIFSTSKMVDYTMQILLAFMILTVNGFVIFALATTSTLYTPTNLIIGSLALSDFGMGLTRPLQALLELGAVQDKNICLVSHSLAVGMSAVSMQHLTFVSIDRYIRIKQPFRYKDIVTKRRVFGIILLLWISCFGLCFMPVMGFYRPNFNGSVCTSEAILEPWCFHLIMTANFQFSSIVLTGIYFKIFLIARRRKSSYVKRFRVRGGYVSSTVRNLKAARLLAVLCVYFLLSWMPFCILRYLAIFSRNTIPVPFVVERLAVTLAVCNSLGNPLLYACGERNVYATMKTIIFNKVKRRKLLEERKCESYM